ncbi:Putative disease resistance RPP13-like protein 1 [Linum perenne]
MDVALIGGSFLSAFFQVLFDRMASPDLVNFIRGQKLNHVMMGRLKLMLNSVSGVLDDAEEKQISKPAVKRWLDDLKDATLHADDLLDEICYEFKRLELEHWGKMRNFISQNSFRDGTNRKLKEILERLEDLVKQKDVLGLIEGIARKPSFQNRVTTSLPDGSAVYGRKNDVEAIVSLLLQSYDATVSSNSIGLVPLLGMGGIGKTTIAQLVYKDIRVQQWFELRAWIYVSAEFDVYKVSKDILEEVCGRSCGSTTLNQLQLGLEKAFEGKRCLLVFDDVWHDKSASDWVNLLKPLQSMAQGSMIIATTRNHSVVSALRTVPTIKMFPPYNLQILDDENCWSLFAKTAFDDGYSSSWEKLEGIGREIMKKCNGLPLAAKTLGCLLRADSDVEKWQNILKSNIWDSSNDNILPALILSYHYLPSHLKPCFAYSAIFPKGYEFEKEEVVRLWMAEGFVIQPEGSRGMEDTCHEYFNDLVSRSFLQHTSEHQFCFTMHDLIHDLAKYVAGEFCYRMEDASSFKIAGRTRHLSYARAELDTTVIWEGMYNAKHMRTLLPVDGSKWWSYDPKCIDDKVLQNIFLRLTRLRVLSLSGYKVSKLPDAIGDLKHLRYLNLSLALLHKLPDTLCNLYNLEILILHKCKNIQALPDLIGKLKQLQIMDISGTQITRLPDSFVSLINLCNLDVTETMLQEMPLQMSNLSSLRNLTDFVVGAQSGSGIKEMGELQHLTGSLRIWNLQNVLDYQDAVDASLKTKKHISRLELRWNGDTDDSLHERGVLESLQPHVNLQHLVIESYGGTSFPGWVGHSSFSHLLSIELSGCKYCSSLPPLGQLMSLERISIKAFEGVVTVGPEFYGSSSTFTETPFRSLKSLKFEQLPEWTDWIPHAGRDGSEAFPVLEDLYIKHCPNLRKTLPPHLPSLERLEIRGCQQLRLASVSWASNIVSMRLKDNTRDVWLEMLTKGLHRLRVQVAQDLLDDLELVLGLSNTLQEIMVKDCNSFKHLQLELFPKLKAVSINGCQSLASLCRPDATLVDTLEHLNFLEISKCPSLLSFPARRLHAPNMTRLILSDCTNLKSLPAGMHSLLPSLEELFIDNCPCLDSFPAGRLPLKLETLTINGCDQLIAGCRKWNLQLLPCLSSLSIGQNEEMECLPVEEILPHKLNSLKIRNFHNLKSLGFSPIPAGNNHMSNSIKKLEFKDCPFLESFSIGSIFAGLVSLEIKGCNRLVDGRTQWNLEAMSHLEELYLSTDDNLESFPDDMMPLPPTLTSLYLWNLPNLVCLNCSRLEQLRSLKEVKISNCPKLQFVPVDGLPTSLSSIYIN